MQFIRDIYAAKRAANRPACVAEASNWADASRTANRKSEIETTNTPARRRPVISFEFFPPKTGEGDRNLLEKQIPALLQAKPDYCSVTYGAGGSTRDKTLMIVDRIQRQHGLTALAHLTCVGHTRGQVRELLEKIRSLGCKNILALRGDPPGGGEFQPTPGGFEFAAQLVKFIRESGDFSIGVAGFPEGHIACRDGKHADWRHLKEKMDAGADFVLTQLFFDNADYFEFRDYRCRQTWRSRAARARHHSDFERGANHEIHAALRRENSAAAPRQNSINWRTMMKPPRNSASNTPRNSARNCCAPAHRDCIFTR